VNTIYLVPGSGEEDYFLRCLLHTFTAEYPEIELVLFTDPVNDAAYAQWNRVCLSGAERETRFSHIESMLQQAVHDEGIDRLLTPLASAPTRCGCPTVPYIMEPEMLDIAAEGGPYWINRKRKDLVRAAENAAALIVPTEFARKRILKHLEIPLNKMVVARPGVNHAVTTPQPCTIETPYLLSVGPTHTHRNTERLLQAFERIANTIPHNLVVVGEPGQAEPSTWGPRVLRINRCPSDQLAGLYQHCDLVVCPLLEPCSGIPVLEAMYCGARVVAGKVGAIPEVARSAPFYCDPASVSSIVSTILYGLSEEESLRKQRIRSGKQIAGEYTWSRCAERVLIAFNRKPET